MNSSRTKAQTLRRRPSPSVVVRLYGQRRTSLLLPCLARRGVDALQHRRCCHAVGHRVPSPPARAPEPERPLHPVRAAPVGSLEAALPVRRLGRSKPCLRGAASRRSKRWASLRACLAACSARTAHARWTSPTRLRSSTTAWTATTCRRSTARSWPRSRSNVRSCDAARDLGLR